MRTMFYGSNARTFRYAKKLRLEMTHEEKILWCHLSNKKLDGFRFKRQHPVRNYIADFYCHRAKLIIEVDGKIHEQPQQILHDKERTAKIEESGCRILRFTNTEIRYHIDFVLDTIKQALGVPAGNATSPSGEAEGVALSNNKKKAAYELTSTPFITNATTIRQGTFFHHLSPAPCSQ